MRIGVHMMIVLER
jgi:hypothetical protein